MKAILLTISIWSAAISENVAAGNATDSSGTSHQEGAANADGTIQLHNVEVPLSAYLSSESKRRYLSTVEGLPLEKLLARARSVYPTRIEDVMIGGIRSKLVNPENGILEQNRERVLINLHGGAFFCNEAEQLLESIPIASVGRIKVISIDYRCSPENKFPAASEDVASVYKALLVKYPPRNVGIYGSSAGGILTAESIAWFQKEKLPSPGAIGLFCAADALEGGDSRYIWGPKQTGPKNPPPNGMPYFDSAGTTDPLVSPTLYADQLKEFPPTLLVTGSRDQLASPIIYAHAQLVKAGVYAELHVWEGMGHGFFVDVDMPESREMYEVTAKFFNTHLGEN
jgi:monoterpene epsilon-lactone hydrolase